MTTKKVSRLLTTAEVNHFVALLKATPAGTFVIVSTEETITVTHRNKTVFKSLSTGSGWITRFNEDLFIA